jgi:hypothetical protein
MFKKRKLVANNNLLLDLDTKCLANVLQYLPCSCCNHLNDVFQIPNYNFIFNTLCQVCCRLNSKKRQMARACCFHVAQSDVKLLKGLKPQGLVCGPALSSFDTECMCTH